METIQVSNIEFDSTGKNIALIECFNTEDVEKVYTLVRNETDFIVAWGKGNSRLIIGNMLTPKMLNGEMTVSSKEN